MANGRVEIHDPILDLEVTTTAARDLESTSDPDSMKDTVEFRLLMAYAKRRRPQKESPQKESPSQDLSVSGDANESSSPQTPEKEKKKKKRRMSKGLRRFIFSCVTPKTKEEESYETEKLPDPDVDVRCFPTGEEEEEEEEEDELKEAANTLTKIADEIPLVHPDLEADSPKDEVVDENVETMIGLLLRDAGDRLNDNEMKDLNLTSELFGDYGFFKLLMSTLLTRMGLKSPHPDSPGPKASPKAQIAVACEVTSRLSEVNPLPRNRLLHHGARYLQHYYSPWVEQQGGYVEAFYSDDEDEE